jgi:hypothetical protein
VMEGKTCMRDADDAYFSPGEIQMWVEGR